MKSVWAKSWNASKQPRKQRKYRYNAALHTRSKFLSVHLTSDLRKKYGKRSIRVRTGDKIKILVGNKKGNEGKVSKVDVKNTKVYIEGMERIKIDGSKIQIAFDPTNLLLTSISNESKRFKKTKDSKKKEVTKQEIKGKNPKVKQVVKEESQAKPKESKKEVKQEEMNEKTGEKK